MVDALLDYNLLLGLNWFYAMTAVASTVFRTVQFLHLGRIITIDQLDFCMLDVTTSMANNIPMLGQSPPPYQSIGVGMLKDSSLMGVFPSTPPSTDSTSVNMITSFDYEPKGHYVFESTSLIPHKAMYDAIQPSFDDHTNDLHLVASDPYHFSYWLEPSLPTIDYLTENFPSDESIIEIMSMDESIWEDHHHRSMFLPNMLE